MALMYSVISLHHVMSDVGSSVTRFSGKVIFINYYQKRIEQLRCSGNSKNNIGYRKMKTTLKSGLVEVLIKLDSHKY